MVNQAGPGLELNAVLRGTNFSQPADLHVLEFGQYLEELRAYFIVLGIDMDVFLPGVGVLLRGGSVFGFIRSIRTEGRPERRGLFSPTSIRAIVGGSSRGILCS